MMTPSVYKINKGINAPIEFKGLKSQYIGYLAGGGVLSLLVFAILFVLGLNIFLCVGLLVILSGSVIGGTYYLSNTYGEHGLTKKLMRQKLPTGLRFSGRHLFVQLNPSQYENHEEH
ncbi:DUF4133 domain-containing protein [Fulvivirga maritima]|uniref:DUF4133 domain-containing protein n=1 Tax=Fulvivirga maritima TaxID=2904247 RepID=UPI001F2EB6D5|nr:DUF4133 domain-containing protein [Fulvivirga maritima]UII29081.1 DUF4133 domain-containing protein [Fulvivirga maritima]